MYERRGMYAANGEMHASVADRFLKPSVLGEGFQEPLTPHKTDEGIAGFHATDQHVRILKLLRNGDSRAGGTGLEVAAMQSRQMQRPC